MLTDEAEDPRGGWKSKEVVFRAVCMKPPVCVEGRTGGAIVRNCANACGLFLRFAKRILIAKYFFKNKLNLPSWVCNCRYTCGCSFLIFSRAAGLAFKLCINGISWVIFCGIPDAAAADGGSVGGRECDGPADNVGRWGGATCTGCFTGFGGCCG